MDLINTTTTPCDHRYSQSEIVTNTHQSYGNRPQYHSLPDHEQADLGKSGMSLATWASTNDFLSNNLSTFTLCMNGTTNGIDRIMLRFLISALVAGRSFDGPASPSLSLLSPLKCHGEIEGRAHHAGSPKTVKNLLHSRSSM